MDESFDINKLEKSSKTSLVISSLGLLLIIGALIYSFIKLSSLQNEITILDGKKNSLKTEIDSLSKLKDTLQTRLTISNTANLSEGIIDKEELEQNLTDTTASVAPRIYLHIKNESQRRKAKEVGMMLQKNGYVVPGIENVGNRSPQVTQLRYFTNSKQEQEDLKQILGLFNKSSVRVVEQFVRSNQRIKIRPRHYEIWFGSDFVASGY